MITGIQPTRAVDGEGPSGAAISPLLCFLEIPPQNHSVFLFLTNRLIKRTMIDVREIKELCVFAGGKEKKKKKKNAPNLHITNLKPRIFRSAHISPA